MHGRGVSYIVRDNCVGTGYRDSGISYGTGLLFFCYGLQTVRGIGLQN